MLLSTCVAPPSSTFDAAPLETCEPQEAGPPQVWEADIPSNTVTAPHWRGALRRLQAATRTSAQDQQQRPAHRRLLAVEAPLLASLEVVLSTERRAPIEWDYAKVKYSLTVPSEAVAAALVAVANPAYSGVIMALYRPDDGMREVLASGQPSSFQDVPTEEAARFMLELQRGAQASNYTISVLRSTITSGYEFVHPDPAQSLPPQSTLTGLTVYSLYGQPARTDPHAFEPQRSQYVAVVDMEMSWVYVIASQNDPDATLQIRVDGQEWDWIVSGVNSGLLAVPGRGWLLVEVRVNPPALPALIYQVVITRGVICHERCRACFGPGEDNCLSCRAPLVLFEGRCDVTACPPNGYWEWDSYQCRRCDPSCAQCTGPGKDACTLCPALHFLSPEKYRALTGPCVITCPIGKFAHPPSRRCRRPPAASFKTFYLAFVLRVPFSEFQFDSRLQRSVLNTTAFVLGVALSDVRAYRMSQKEFASQITIEVVSPFLPKAEADRILIDTWFGAFEIPVDEVISMTWDSVHPPVPELPEEPMIPSWGYGIIVSGVMAVAVLCPMYCFFFRRINNTRKRYVTRVGVDQTFMDIIVHQSPAWLIKRFMAHDGGEKAHISDGAAE